jgi:competence protein ComFB
MAYRNYTEDAVLEELVGVLDQLKDSCKCEKCRQDMLAYALNRLPPKYVVTDLGGVYTKLYQFKAQAKADAAVRLVEAARVVKANPRH